MTTAYITHADCLLHEMGPDHPERPARLSAIHEQMQSSGLMRSLRCLEAPLAHVEDLKRVHASDYVDLIFEHAPAEGYVQLDPDTLMNPYTLAAARRRRRAGRRRGDGRPGRQCVLRGTALRPSRNSQPADGLLYI